MIDSQIHILASGNLPLGNRMEFARRAARARLPYRDPLAILPRVGQIVWDEDGAAALAYLDRCGVERAVIQVCDFGPCFGEEADWSVEEIHQHAFGLARRFAGRLAVCCGVDPRRHNAVDLLDRAIREDGAVGWQCFPANGYSPNDPVCSRLYETCLRHGLPVVIRTGSGDIGPYTAFSHPFLVEDVARRYRDLEIVMEHAGGGLDMLWREALMVASVNPNVTLQLGLWQTEVYGEDDREAEFLRVLRTMQRRIGAHRVMWGSDHDRARPDGQTGRWAELFQNLPAVAARHGLTFTAAEAQLISHDNAKRVFRLADRDESDRMPAD